MTNPNVQLVLISTGEAETAALRKRFAGQANIRIFSGNGLEATRELGLDALWMGPMQASYFGISGPVPLHVAKVFPMPSASRNRGFPKWLAVGVALDPARSYSIKYRNTIGAIELAKAVRIHNANHQSMILKVGSVPANLGLDELHNTDAFTAVRDNFAAHYEGIRVRQQVKQTA